jgi:hypothetical protein
MRESTILFIIFWDGRWCEWRVKRKRWWCTHAQSLTRKRVIKFPHFIVEKQGKERRQITATIKERTKT